MATRQTSLGTGTSRHSLGLGLGRRSGRSDGTVRRAISRRPEEGDSSSSSSWSLSSSALAITALAPAVCFAWLGLPVPDARAATTGPPVTSSSVLDRIASVRHKGNQDALYRELVEYYTTRNTTGGSQAMTVKRKSKSKQRPTADLKREVLKEAGPAVGAVAHTDNKRTEQSQLQSDKVAVKAEMSSALAIGIVCIFALLFWRFRAVNGPLSDEAWGGIDKDFIPIRNTDTGETEEQKEFARKEAARAIAAAKRKEQEFADRRARGEAASPVVQVMGARADAAAEVDAEAEARGTVEPPSEDEMPKAGAVSTTGSTARSESSPLLVAVAMLSVMADDIKKELNNLPMSVLPASRTLTCTRVKGAGKSMVVRTPRVKMHPRAGGRPATPAPISNGTATGTVQLDGKDLLLAPVATALKEVRGKRVAPLFADKYNPMTDLHEFVSSGTASADAPKQPKSDRDPLIALLAALRAWEGPTVPESIKKYDPASNLDKIATEVDATAGDATADPVIALIKAAKAFDGPKASNRLTKYDPLGQLETIPVAGTEEGKEYCLLQALLRAAPEREDGSDLSFIKALVNAEVDVSSARYDVWKAAIDLKFPEINLETFFPVVGDIMARLRDGAMAEATTAEATTGTVAEDARQRALVAEAERKADEAERKALALLERIERKEDELLSKVQQLKATISAGDADDADDADDN